MGWSSTQRTGLTFRDADRSVEGYTLVTPMFGDGSYLIDHAGRIVHRWQFESFVAGYAKAEIDAAGNEVARLSLWQLLDPAADAICPIEGRREWMHVNGIDLTADGGLRFSCRNTSTVGLGSCSLCTSLRSRAVSERPRRESEV